MRIAELTCLDGTPSDSFPPTSAALDFPNGLLAWGGDLSPDRLLAAYRRGVFPWYSAGEPILWWSPDPRCVLFPDQIYVSSRTRRKLRQRTFRLTADCAFHKVIKACAACRPDRLSTWITAEMVQAYNALHKSGIAHSIEAWHEDRLVGGIYGLALGQVFFGESMFSLETDASKLALITLCRNLVGWEFGMIDCQVKNPHLMSMGAEELDRAAFEARLEALLRGPETTASWDRRFRSDWRW